MFSAFFFIYSKSNDVVHQHIFNPAFNRWLAPEILVGKKPSFESDIYSLCVIVAETISGMFYYKYW